MNAPKGKTVSVLAPAKVNLFLHVTGRRDDGFHLLDSLTVFADAGDLIIVEPAPLFSFSVKGPYATAFTAAEHSGGKDSKNLAVRAAHRFCVMQKKPMHFRMTLIKNLPLASGLGSGSADAAAVVWALMELWDMPPGMIAHFHGIMLDLGADVPACLASRPVIMRGIGEQLLRPPAMGEISALLVNPGIPCPTEKVFAAFDKPYRAQINSPADLSDFSALTSFLSSCENMLTAAALTAAPVIADVIGALERQTGCALARMSGSGATCFGLFGDREESEYAAGNIAADFPSWWVRPVIFNRPERY